MHRPRRALYDARRHAAHGPPEPPQTGGIHRPLPDHGTRAQTRLTEIALALAAFKSERGFYPAALSELAPEFLTNVPQDNFSDRSFIYARTSSGYALYSVGPNLVDDGGASNSSSDDIVAN